MEQYDKNVAIIMEFLKTENYSPSVLSVHRLCYTEFRNYLLSHEKFYTYETATTWLEEHREIWGKTNYIHHKHCIKQLNDVFFQGTISPKHLGYRKPAYSLLSPSLQQEIDEFIVYGLQNSQDSSSRRACSRFMLFLQTNGRNSIRQLDYELLLRFHKEDYHSSSKSKDVYEELIRTFLRYHANKERCSLGHALALNKMLIPQIIQVEPTTFPKTSVYEEYLVTWSQIECFFEKMREIGYAKSVRNYTKHILKLLYIFLDMHQLLLREDILWTWFELVKPLLKTNWKQARRSLSQFLLFVKEDRMITKVTGNPTSIAAIDQLPEWARVELRKYLDLLQREGWKKSTISMQKVANVKFCQYLYHHGIKSFTQITPEVLQKFNQQDIHKTSESTSAYHCRIRSFLIYLYEQKQISNPFLYKALSSVSAPSTKLISVLSKEEVIYLWSMKIELLSSKELRDYAMVMISLSMGFRASDIVSLRFQEIDWKKCSISLIQQKTEKTISIPMPIRIGNILFRYLQKARPKSSSPYIFIQHRAPYDKLSPGVCDNALYQILPKQKMLKNGFHVLRRTFATNLLRGNTPVTLISDSLGHSTNSTVYHYLSLDEERMRLCPLSMKDTKISLQGGIFHV